MGCLVCGTSELQPSRQMAHGRLVECVRCGRFVITDEAEDELAWRFEKQPLLRSVLSHFIRRQQGGKPPTIGRNDLAALENERLATPDEQRDALVLWIGTNQPSHVERAKVHRSELAAIIGAYQQPGRPPEAEDGLQWLQQQLQEENLYVWGQEGEYERPQLTMKGWAVYHEIKLRMPESRIAFMAMKFGDAELHAVVDQHFRFAVERAGFSLRLLTDGQGAGNIDNQIRAAIRTAAFVVADLSHDNNGAYFEAGFAEGIGLPVIYTCEAEKFRAKKTHFDTNHMVTIPWDKADLPQAANLLTQTIRNTLPTRAKMSD